jgi:hypothetical protein
MTVRLDFPRPFFWDENYWLTRCEGFRVDTPAGYLGVVAEVRFHSRHDRPDHLVARGGMFGNRVTIVPVSEGLQIIPGEGRIILGITAERCDRRRGYEALRRVRAYLAGALGGEA